MYYPLRRQIQIIANTLVDPATPPADLEKFNDPWRTYCRWILAWIAEDPDDINPDRLLLEFNDAFNPYTTKGNDDFPDNYESIKRAMEHPIVYPDITTLLDSVPELRWIWKDWLPRGLSSLLAAAPGTGKSYLALDLAHRIIAGTQYPDGTPVSDPGPVLYVEAENAPALQKQRLAVWPEHHLRQLYMMLPGDERFVINFDDLADRDRLRDMVWDIRPRLVIVDSYGSCTLKGENNKEDVQFLLAFFTQVAKEFECAILVIHHLRKSGPAGQLSFVPLSLDSVRGSSHIVAMARQILALQFVPTGPEPGNTDPRRLSVMKSNIGPAPTPLGVAFKPHSQNPDVAELHYGDAPKPFRDPTRVEECADFILQAISDAGEPLPPGEVIALAEAEGYYRSLVYRSRKELGELIMDTRAPRDPNNRWALPEMLGDDAEDSENVT